MRKAGGQGEISAHREWIPIGRQTILLSVLSKVTRYKIVGQTCIVSRSLVRKGEM